MCLSVGFKLGKASEVGNSTIIVASVADSLARRVVFRWTNTEHSAEAACNVLGQYSEICTVAAYYRITCIYKYVSKRTALLHVDNRSVVAVYVALRNGGVLHKHVFNSSFAAGAQEVAFADNSYSGKSNIFEYTFRSHGCNESVGVPSRPRKSVDCISATVKYALEAFRSVGLAARKHNHICCGNIVTETEVAAPQLFLSLARLSNRNPVCIVVGGFDCLCNNKRIYCNVVTCLSVGKTDVYRLFAVNTQRQHAVKCHDAVGRYCRTQSRLANGKINHAVAVKADCGQVQNAALCRHVAVGDGYVEVDCLLCCKSSADVLGAAGACNGCNSVRFGRFKFVRSRYAFCYCRSKIIVAFGNACLDVVCFAVFECKSAFFENTLANKVCTVKRIGKCYRISAC